MMWIDYFLQFFVQALAVICALATFVLGWMFLSWGSWKIARRRRRLRGRGRRGLFGGLL